MITWIIAKTTFGDAMRQKTLQIFLIVALALIIMSFAFANTLTFTTQSATGDLSFIKNFGLGMITLAAILICVMTGVYMIPREIERKTIYTILSKPVNRWEFILGKIIGSWLTLAAVVGLMGAIFIVIVTVKAILLAGGNAASSTAVAAGLKDAATAPVQIFDINMVYGVILAFLQSALLSSIIIMFSVIVTPTVNFFLGIGVYIVGSLITIIETLKNTASDLSPVIKFLYNLFYMIIPNFDLFNVTNTLLHPNANPVTWGYLGYLFVYSLFYSLMATLIAVIIFYNKEV